MNTQNRIPRKPRGAEEIRPDLRSWITLFLGCLLVPAVFLLYSMPV
jgi:hypothetical protein